MRLKPVKKRHPKGIHRDEVIVIYDGESRMQAKPVVSNEPFNINLDWKDIDLTGWTL
jgi:hypothetical protein